MRLESAQKPAEKLVGEITHAMRCWISMREAEGQIVYTLESDRSSDNVRMDVKTISKAVLESSFSGLKSGLVDIYEYVY